MNSKPSGSEWGSNIRPQGARQRMLLSQALNVPAQKPGEPGQSEDNSFTSLSSPLVIENDSDSS